MTGGLVTGGHGGDIAHLATPKQKRPSTQRVPHSSTQKVPHPPIHKVPHPPTEKVPDQPTDEGPHPSPRIESRPFRKLPRRTGLFLLLLAVMAQPKITALELNSASRLSEINLLSSLHLHNTTFAGLEQKPGPHSSTPAAFFSGSSRAVYFSSQVRDNIMSLLKSSKEFSFLTSIRQTRHNSGTIFAFSYGKYQTNRYLEVEASGRQDVLRVHYSPVGGLLQQNINVESFNLRLADDSWHRLAVVVSGDQIEVFLDCRSVHRRVVSPIDMTFEFPEQLRKEHGEMTLWLGQRNQDHALFKGYLQDTHLVAGHHGYLKQCPGTDSSCPTCGQFRELEDTVKRLESTLQKMSHTYESRLREYESRIQELEAKDCSKSCLMTGGGLMQHGHTIEKGCEKCSCNEGKMSCSPTECPALACANPVAPSNGSCCPTCKSSCKRSNIVYEHGEDFSPRRCLTCNCIDGNIKCNRINPQRDCPKLDCPKEDTILEEGKCCSVCKVSDWCSRGHNCHPMADCQDGLFNYSCHCKNGFQGNGTHCEDINECDQLGDRNGHHCTFNNTQCVNTLGSYTCACVAGFSWDSTNTSCVPLNLCSSASHKCHLNATCEFLGPATVACHCNKGFTGSGTDCQPICSTPCHNGGTCVAPGQCACAPGFAGSHCQDDIDECLLGPAVHKCLGASVCVNRPGWHYCACHSGYRSYHNPLDGATTCVDLDECATAVNTCHHSATCKNTLGSYSCYCGGKDHGTCSTVCVVDGIHHNDGTSWQDGCNQCRCESGRSSCRQVECNCKEAGRDRGCCPQCYDKRTCPHQDIPGLKYNSGDKWIYRCQECECLRGEVDCWPVDCPPTHCSSPVHPPGSCCPVCPGDNVTDCYSNNNDQSGNCVHASMVYQDGDSWQLPYSDCTSCQCRVPFCDHLVSKADSIGHRWGIYIALLSLHVAWWAYSTAVLTGSSISSSSKQPQGQQQRPQQQQQQQRRPQPCPAQLQTLYFMKTLQFHRVNMIPYHPSGGGGFAVIREGLSHEDRRIKCEGKARGDKDISESSPQRKLKIVQRGQPICKCRLSVNLPFQKDLNIFMVIHSDPVILPQSIQQNKPKCQKQFLQVLVDCSKRNRKDQVISVTEEVTKTVALSSRIPISETMVISPQIEVLKTVAILTLIGVTEMEALKTVVFSSWRGVLKVMVYSPWRWLLKTVSFTPQKELLKTVAFSPQKEVFKTVAFFPRRGVLKSIAISPRKGVLKTVVLSPKKGVLKAITTFLGQRIKRRKKRRMSLSQESPGSMTKIKKPLFKKFTGEFVDF